MMFHTILLVSYNGTQIHILHALKDIALYKRIRLLELPDKILHLYTLRCILTATGCTGIREFTCTLDKMQVIIIPPLLDIIFSDQIQCSRPKLLSKIFKIIVKNFREIFSVLQTEKGSDFTHYPFLSSGFHVPQLSGVFPSWGSYLVSPQSAHPQNNQALHIYGQCVLPLN